MAKWLITFENGYCGCNQEEIIDGTYEEAQDWAEESLMDYAETWTHIAFGWGEEFTEEEFDSYFENCYYNITLYEEENEE